MFMTLVSTFKPDRLLAICCHLNTNKLHRTLRIVQNILRKLNGPIKLSKCEVADSNSFYGSFSGCGRGNVTLFIRGIKWLNSSDILALALHSVWFGNIKQHYVSILEHLLSKTVIILETEEFRCERRLTDTHLERL